MSLIPPTPTKIVGQRAHEFLIARIISGAEVLAPLKQKIPVAAYIGQIFDKGRLRLSLVGGEVIAQLSAPPPSNLKPGSLVSLRITNGGTAIQIQTSREKNRNEAGARLNVNPIVFDNKHKQLPTLKPGSIVSAIIIPHPTRRAKINPTHHASVKRLVNRNSVNHKVTNTTNDRIDLTSSRIPRNIGANYKKLLNLFVPKGKVNPKALETEAVNIARRLNRNRKTFNRLPTSPPQSEHKPQKLIPTVFSKSGKIRSSQGALGTQVHPIFKVNSLMNLYRAEDPKTEWSQSKNLFQQHQSISSEVEVKPQNKRTGVYLRAQTTPTSFSETNVGLTKTKGKQPVTENVSNPPKIFRPLNRYSAEIFINHVPTKTKKIMGTRGEHNFKRFRRERHFTAKQEYSHQTANVRILSVHKPSKSLKASLKLNNSSSSAIGILVGKGSSGQSVIETKLGFFTLNGSLNYPNGTRIAMEIRNIPKYNAKLLAFQPPGSIGPQFFGNWGNLEYLLNNLKLPEHAHDYQEFSQKRIARPGQQLTAAAIFFLNMVRRGDVKTWLGHTITGSGGQTREGIVQALQDDFVLMQRVSELSDAGWRAFSIPMLDENQLSQIQLFIYQDRKSYKERGKHGTKQTRFIVDLTLSNIGEMQIEGRLNDRKVDIVIRTQNSLTKGLQTGIQYVFLKALSGNIIAGNLNFKVYKKLPRLPIEHLNGYIQNTISSTYI